YEKDARFWAEEGTPLDFGHELLPDDLERISDNVMRAMERLPALETAGIKRNINGPMIWSPDGAALFGPVPELKNYFCCNGIIPGFSQSGGLGSQLAQWIIEGEPEYDMFPWDMARYGHWANKAFTKARTFDAYSHRFKIHFPFEEREAGRPIDGRKRPVYERQKEKGAVFGLNYGWEHPLWYAPEGVSRIETYGYERQDWWHHVGDECRALRSAVGVIDISNFAKYEIKGAGAFDWLNAFAANTIPTEVGRSCLTPLLGIRGGIAGDFTITKLAEDHYFMVGSGMAERYHQRYFDAVPLPADTSFTCLTEQLTGFNIAGPNARTLLARLTNEDMTNDAFKFMRSKLMTVAGLDARVLRVSFTGDLGFEVYVPQDQQLALYDALFEAGADLGVVPVGGRALGSLRVEKGYGSWGREYSPEYWPQEVGLERLVKTDKGDFLGKSGFEAIKDKAPRELLSILEIEVDQADATGGEPIFTTDGKPVGRVSTGAYGYSVEKSLALGFIKKEHHQPGTEYHVYVLGQPHKATLLAEAPFDPKGERLRG
ncbi:MAG: glycine cleavage T C-terminal barrel domain-containing protein, partial [Alphaproteobacteria bacterium]